MSNYKEQLEDLVEHSGAVAEGGVVAAELDKSSGELSEVSEEAEGISRTVCKNTELHESLESYVRSFTETCPVQEWNRQTAAQYQVGLGAILGAAGVCIPSEQYSPSFEAVDRTMSGEEHAQGAMERTKAFFARIREAIKAAVAAFIEAVKTLVNKIRYNGTAIQKAADELDLRLKKHPDTHIDSNSGKVELMFRMPEGYYQMREAIAKKPPHQALASTQSALQGLITAWHNSYRSAVELCVKGVESGKIPSFAGPLSSLSSYRTGFLLPGHEKLLVKMGEGDELTQLTSATVIVESDADKSDKFMYVEAMDYSQIKASASAIRAAGKYLVDAGRDLDKIVSEVNQSVKNANSSMDKVKDDVVNPDVKRLARALAPLATQCSRAHRFALPYLGRWAHMVYLHARKSIVARDQYLAKHA